MAWARRGLAVIVGWGWLLHLLWGAALVLLLVEWRWTDLIDEGPGPTPTPYAVKAAQDVPELTTLRRDATSCAKDLAVSATPNAAVAVAAAAAGPCRQIDGRLTTHDLAAGQTIDPDELGPLATVVPTPFAAVTLWAADPLGMLDIGDRLDLALLPRHAATPESGAAPDGTLILDRVVILRVGEAGKDDLVPILVAVSSQDATRIAADLDRLVAYPVAGGS